MFKERDKVLVTDNLGLVLKGTIVSVNEFREPSMKYAVDLDHYGDDYVFVGEDSLRMLDETKQEIIPHKKNLLDQWYFDFRFGKLIMSGEIYNDSKSRFKNGDEITTSEIKFYDLENKIIRTKNSEYNLGKRKIDV